MKFIIDAQLPPGLSQIFQQHQCDCIHVLTLTNKDKSTDKEIRDIADEQDRIVVTKDFDFYHSHMSIQKPRRLLLVTTGNIKNKQLLELFNKNLKTILIAFKQGDFVELSNTDIITI